MFGKWNWIVGKIFYIDIVYVNSGSVDCFEDLFVEEFVFFLGFFYWCNDFVGVVIFFYIVVDIGV